MEVTLHDIDENRMDTIPFICEDKQLQLQIPRMKAGTQMGDTTLIAPMTITKGSELWFARDYFDEKCVVKITDHPSNEEVILSLRSMENENLAEILDCGRMDFVWYEVYPYYKNGHLTGKIEEEEIRQIVLPGIIHALEQLHAAGIAHNDIKPENIFWSDDHSHIILGDFDAAREIKTRPDSYTPAYIAPEILLNDVCRRASDWASVGLLLATLVSGELLVPAKTRKDAMLMWEKGVYFKEGSFQLRQLINGMIHIDPRKRLGPNAAKKWCGNSTFGGEERSSSRKNMEVVPLTIEFENPPWVAADVAGLLKGITDHWDYSVFLFQQGKLDKFLSQFQKEWVTSCKKYRRMTSEEDGLYYLTLELSGGQSFIWRGRRYDMLLEMENVWEEGEQGEQDVLAFLQRGHVIYYLQQKHAVQEQIEFVKRLQNISKMSPYETCLQLFQALRGDDGLNWNGAVFNDLNDLTDWMFMHIHDLEESVEELFESKRFEAWMAYQGMEHMLDDIRRKCEL